MDRVFCIIAGIIIGLFLGMFVMALMAVSKREDEHGKRN